MVSKKETAESALTLYSVTETTETWLFVWRAWPFSTGTRSKNFLSLLEQQIVTSVSPSAPPTEEQRLPTGTRTFL